MARMVIKDARAAWSLWCVLAIGVTVATLLKRDIVVLQEPAGAVVEGRVIEQTRASVTIRVKRDECGRDFAEQPEREIERRDIAVVSRLGARSVTGNYRYGAERWRHGLPMYTEGPHGFLYLPQAAMLFVPFEMMPVEVGEVLWRLVGLGVYVGGVWTLSRRLVPGRLAEAFTLATLLAIPGSLGSAQNGQTNLVMGGLCALGAVSASEARWWRTSLWLMLAMAFKPVALPVVLLLAAVKPRLIPALAAGAVVLAGAPFVHPDPAYVWGQYQGAFSKVIQAADPSSIDAFFSDIRGMLRDFGLAFTDRQVLPVRVAAALLTLGACVWIGRRSEEPGRCVWVVLMGVGYIMAFSPRTEGVTYAMIAVVAAVVGAMMLLERRWALGVFLAAYCLVLQFSMPLTDVLTGEERKYWLRPLLTLVLMVWVVWEATYRSKPRGRSGDGQERPLPE